MILIPEGKFIIGSNIIKEKKDIPEKLKEIYKNEYPMRTIYLNSFYLDKYEVTNKEFKEFADTVNLMQRPENWKNGSYDVDRENHPVTYVTWFDAVYYCRWKKKRLPSEEEWEKAARGSKGFIYPWGNKYSPDNGNYGPNNIKDTVQVGTFLKDKSIFNIYDMAGNVKEWTNSWFNAYPGSEYSSLDFGRKFKVVKGSSFMRGGHYFYPAYVQTTQRLNIYPSYATGDIGFRCAKPNK